MAIGLQAHYERKRRRRAALIKLTVSVVFLGVAGVFGYQLGIERVQARQDQLQQEIADLEEELAAVLERNQRLESQVSQQSQRIDELETELAEARPPEALREVLAAAEGRVEDGVAAERLALIVAQAEPAESCTELRTRRFLVSTPIRQHSTNNVVAFGNGTVSISATGRSARDANGNAESWFAPDEPVTVTFEPADDERQEVEGRLPLTHTMIVGATEYRFRLTAGARGFMQASGEACELFRSSE